MKIKKLITLSGFVDKFKSGGELETVLVLIDQYNNFLKQTLIKDMFVNELDHPDQSVVIWSCKHENSLYNKQLKQYQEAEKKIIFESVTSVEEENIGLCKVYINDIKIAHYWKRDSTWLCLYKTLHDLAEATKGTLKLKNFVL